MRFSIFLTIFFIFSCLEDQGFPLAYANSTSKIRPNHKSIRRHAQKWLPLPPPSFSVKNLSQSQTDFFSFPAAYLLSALPRAFATSDQESAWKKYAVLVDRWSGQEEIQSNPKLKSDIAHLIRLLDTNPPPADRDLRVMDLYFHINKTMDSSTAKDEAQPSRLSAAATRYIEALKNKNSAETLKAYTEFSQAYAEENDQDEELQSLSPKMNQLITESKSLSELAQTKTLTENDYNKLFRSYADYSTQYLALQTILYKSRAERKVRLATSHPEPCPPERKRGFETTDDEESGDEEEQEGEEKSKRSDDQEESRKIPHKRASHESVPKGLRNLSNTCYANSAIQLMLRDPSVLKVLSKSVSLKQRPEETSNLFTARQKVRNAFTNVVLHLQGNPAIHNQDDWIHTFHQSVAEYWAIHAKEAFQAGKAQQTNYDLTGSHLSKEEFTALLQKSQTDLKPLKDAFLFGLTARQKASEEYLTQMRELLEVDQEAQFQEITHVRYISKGAAPVKPDSENEITSDSLVLKPEKASTLDQLIATTLGHERFDAGEQYAVDKHTSLSTQNPTGPPSLLLKINRNFFEHDTSIKKSFPIEITDQITVPFTVQQVDKSIRMNLKAVTVHKGTSANHGHYVTYVRNTAKKTWTLINDSETEELTDAQMSENVEKNQSHLDLIRLGATAAVYAPT